MNLRLKLCNLKCPLLEPLCLCISKNNNRICHALIYKPGVSAKECVCNIYKDMRPYSYFASWLIGACNCFPVNGGHRDGYIHFDLKPQSNPDLRINSLLFNQDLSELDLPITNKVISYTARLGVGTPPQYVDAVVDTGSSDLWVSASSQVTPQYFEPNKSSTLVSNNTLFAINYSKGSGVGTWATDNMRLGNLTITNQTFGTLNTSFSSSVVTGILGLGPMHLESQLTSTYPNFPQRLKDQGYISKNAYSVFLNTLAKPTGDLLFGAVDGSKYSGPLYTVQMSPSRRMDVSLSKIKVNNEDISWTPSWLPLDTGTSICFLPPDVFISIASRINNLHYVGGAFFAESTNFDYNQSMIFDFSGAQIHIPIKDIMVHSKDIFLPSADIPSNYDLVLGIFPNSASSGVNILGATFLRSAYVVYDLESWEISIAQANVVTYPQIMPFHNNTEASIKPIISSVPGAQPAPYRV